MSVDPERVEALPQEPGVYLLKDARGKVLYVGKATSLRDRVALIYPTSFDFVFSFFGVLLAGAVPVPLEPPLRRRFSLVVAANLVRHLWPRVRDPGPVAWRDLDGGIARLISLTRARLLRD